MYEFGWLSPDQAATKWMERHRHALGITPVVTLHHFTTPRWFAESSGWRRPDVVELFARKVGHPDSPDNTQNGMAFRLDAVGICLRQAWEPTRLPMFVAENGIATDDDTRRVEYLSGALAAVAATVTDGVPVLGYLHWSLLDNYEWGSHRRAFGLIGVDRAGDFARIPKPSPAWLGGVARASASAPPLS